MSKTRTERIAGIAEEIEQLANRRRRLIQEQKKQECNRSSSFLDTTDNES